VLVAFEHHTLAFGRLHPPSAVCCLRTGPTTFPHRGSFDGVYVPRTHTPTTRRTRAVISRTCRGRLDFHRFGFCRFTGGTTVAAVTALLHTGFLHTHTAHARLPAYTCLPCALPRCRLRLARFYLVEHTPAFPHPTALYPTCIPFDLPAPAAVWLVGGWLFTTTPGVDCLPHTHAGLPYAALVPRTSCRCARYLPVLATLATAVGRSRTHTGVMPRTRLPYPFTLRTFTMRCRPPPAGDTTPQLPLPAHCPTRTPWTCALRAAHTRHVVHGRCCADAVAATPAFAVTLDAQHPATHTCRLTPRVTGCWFVVTPTVWTLPHHTRARTTCRSLRAPDVTTNVANRDAFQFSQAAFGDIGRSYADCLHRRYILPPVRRYHLPPTRTYPPLVPTLPRRFALV